MGGQRHARPQGRPIIGLEKLELSRCVERFVSMAFRGEGKENRRKKKKSALL
jgi:hypothetical protein